MVRHTFTHTAAHPDASGTRHPVTCVYMYVYTHFVSTDEGCVYRYMCMYILIRGVGVYIYVCVSTHVCKYICVCIY